MELNTNSKNENHPEAFVEPRHWVGVEELNPSYWSDEKVKEKRAQEFYDKPVETIDMIDRLDTKGIARRDFLTIMSASMALAGFSCARRPVHKIIPYVVKPEEIVSGVSNYYATTCPETGYGVLAKVREGRPIKLEGNPDHSMSGGKLSARHQAAILDLYDADRVKEPKKMSRNKGAAKGVTWDQLDLEVVAKLKEISAGSGRLKIVSAPLNSPTQKKLISEFLGAFAAGSHIEYDAFVGDNAAAAQLESYGTNVVPFYKFSDAEVVVSLGSDFLGTDANATEYAGDWAKLRALSKKDLKFSKLFVIETMMSVTGANADERFPVRSGDEVKVAAALACEVARQKGAAVPSEFLSYTLSVVAEETGISYEKLKEMATLLVKNSGKSLVVAGHSVSTRNGSSLALQVVANYLNSVLGNEGKTVDGTAKAFTNTGDKFSAVEELIASMNRGSVDALILYKANWIYQLPKVLGFEAALSKVPFVVYVGGREDETAKCSDFLAADHHYLENWGDVEPRKGLLSLQQPTLHPIHNTRSFEDSLLAWSKGGNLKVKGLAASMISNSISAAQASSESAAAAPSYYEYLKASWKEGVLKSAPNFISAWEKALQVGVQSAEASQSPSVRSFKNASLSVLKPFTKSDRTSLLFTSYAKVAMGSGENANNPWLQEMPDPVTTATWDNYLCMSPKTAESLGLKQDDVAKLDVSGETLELPVLIQPGLAFGVVAAAVGYGRTAAGQIGNEVGRDIKVFATYNGKEIVYSGLTAKVARTGKRYQIAVTQWHSATENRPIVNDLTLDEYIKNPGTSNHTDPHLRMKEVPTMWPKHEYVKNRWGMTIDLTACTGCGACVIGCQAENNIPVVGRDNVRKSREMHWIRIDRYYSGSPENPDVVFQPMLCQHCENAPCETVCPVIATVHDDEGMNTQVYNRCVGTRYCQNNCPYKVRRFNFFDHWKSYEGTMNMAWNPDVTVRTRGIMEKCSFCVQRSRDAKQKAKEEGRPLKDGEFKTACQQTCPTDAIVFGNMNDPTSAVTKLKNDDRAFRVLEVLNTVPSISYLSKVRNKAGKPHHEGKTEAKDGEHHG